MHGLAPQTMVQIAIFAAMVGVWSSVWAGFRINRARGLAAVKAELAHRGETALSIDQLPPHKLADRAGLGAAFVFRIVARTREDGQTTHLWAYEPGLITRGPRPLKRLAHGIWVALA